MNALEAQTMTALIRLVTVVDDMMREEKPLTSEEWFELRSNYLEIDLIELLEDCQNNEYIKSISE